MERGIRSGLQPARGREDRLASLAAPAAPRRVRDALAAGFTHRDPAAPGLGFAAGGALDGLTPGPLLAGFASDATEAGHGQLTDDELIGVLCAWRRLASWAAAGEVRAVSELAGRHRTQAVATGNRHLIDHIGDEVAAAMTLTGRSADRLLGLAAGLRRLQACLVSLAEGRIDWPRATVFADELDALDDADAAQIEAEILPGAWNSRPGSFGLRCVAPFWRPTRRLPSAGGERQAKTPGCRPGTRRPAMRRWRAETCGLPR